jgi:hypothetical protein
MSRNRRFRYQPISFKVPLSTKKMRTCLAILPDGTYCNREFMSDGPSNRICPDCKHNQESKCPAEDNRAPKTHTNGPKAPY